MSDFIRPEIWEMFTLLPLQEEHFFAYEALGFPSQHRDPFDRMIVSQAKSEGLTLISSDQALDSYGISRFWKSSS